MGYTMKGSPAKLGTIQGTAGHASALKLKVQENASALKDAGHGGHAGLSAEEAAKRTHGGKMSEKDLERRQKKNKKDPEEEKFQEKREEKEKGKIKPEDKVVKGGTKTWKEGKKASKDQLDSWVAERGKHKKGSPEYDALQNKINKSLGSKTRHGVTETTEGKTKTTTIPGEKTEAITTKRGGKKVTKAEETGTYTKTVKMKGSGKSGEGADVGGAKGVRKSKVKLDYKEGDKQVKVKRKYSKEGDITKKKKTVKADDVVTKTITKGDKEHRSTRVKTRKKGGTGLGSWAKKQLAKRAAKRASKKLTE